MSLHKITPQEALEEALEILSDDNDLFRNETMPISDVMPTIAVQAQRLFEDGKLEEFVCGEYGEVQDLIKLYDAQGLHDWLEECFQGNLFETYFED